MKAGFLGSTRPLSAETGSTSLWYGTSHGRTNWIQQVGGPPAFVTVVDVAARQQAFQLHGHASAVMEVDTSPDGRLLATLAGNALSSLGTCGRAGPAFGLCWATSSRIGLCRSVRTVNWWLAATGMVPCAYGPLQQGRPRIRSETDRSSPSHPLFLC